MKVLDTLIFKKIIAYIIDFILTVPVFMFSFFISLAISRVFNLNIDKFWGDERFIWDIMRALYTSIYASIFYTILEIKYGGTFGRKKLGLKVVSITNDSGEASIYQLLVRNYFRIIEFVFPISYLVLIRSGGSRRIGDYLAKTKVVRE